MKDCILQKIYLARDITASLERKKKEKIESIYSLINIFKIFVLGGQRDINQY